MRGCDRTRRSGGGARSDHERGPDRAVAGRHVRAEHAGRNRGGRYLHRTGGAWLDGGGGALRHHPSGHGVQQHPGDRQEARGVALAKKWRNCYNVGMSPHQSGPRVRGRGTAEQPANRFERLSFEPDLDAVPGPESDSDGRAADVAVRADVLVPTEYFRDASRSIIARNDSPDVPFTYSLNPYRGCLHGCVYCFARPSHAYLELSPGLDFETRLFAKTNAVALLRAELSKRGYRATPIAFGTNTDCYQPLERRYQLMRGLLELLAACDHPLT